MFTRTIELIGVKDFQKLINAKICIVGIGGVGGYIAECLARCGVGSGENGEIFLIDDDVVEQSNINRQIMALNSTINQKKVVAMKNRIKDISSNCNIKISDKRLNGDNIDEFNLESYDYIVDAIDSIIPKVELIEYCHKNNIKIVSATGSGNRYSIPFYQIKDLFETKYDPLSKKLRQLLRKKNILKHNVAVCLTAPQIKTNKTTSIVYHPCVCGAVLSAFVVNELFLIK